MKNKGFVLVETLVASTVILGALIFLFIQFSTIKNAYDKSFRYNTIPGLYSAKVLATFLEENGYEKIETALNNSTSGYVQINNASCITYFEGGAMDLCKNILDKIKSKQVLYVSSINSLQNNLKNNTITETDIFDKDFKEFIIQIGSNEDVSKKKLLISFENNTYAVINIGEDKS